VRAGMKQGDYYEVVLRQSFSAGFEGSPSELFQRVQTSSPSPYEFLLQFGDEQLIGASPEMFVRVEGRRVETSPISGTARRTGDPLKDHDLIRELLNPPKEESELTTVSGWRGAYLNRASNNPLPSGLNRQYNTAANVRRQPCDVP
ncbi:MAG: chorismate-binding protein, partial [Candidatus Solibacter usitatus]|nr:chorismate-binding protein [Candidatus Solibacter usitatus]